MILRGKLIYNGKLVDTRNEPFTVVITSCWANIDLSLITLPSIQNMWYNDNLLYDVSYITKQVVPSVECGYPYDYQLYQVYPDKDGYEVVAPLPLEVKFTYNGAAKYVAIQISKCNPIGENSSVDSDCNDGTLPEERNW